MALADARSRSSFKISSELAKAISGEFGFSLTAKERAKLERAAQHTVDFRRAVLRREPDDSYRALAAAERRQKVIAETVDELLRKLDADGRERGGLASKRVYVVPRNALVGPRYDDGAHILSEAARVLTGLKKLALPDPSRRPDNRPKRKRGRPRIVDADGWDVLIWTTIVIFRGRGAQPTANHQKRR